MKLIKRWGLMRNNREENIAEHSLAVAMTAHTLALINNNVFGGCADAQKTALIALYHETGEIITGDLPTPIKYYDADIERAYKKIEKAAEEKIINMLPDCLKSDIGQYIHTDKSSYEYKLVKAADKICALTKCLEEINGGNNEFSSAKKYLQKTIADMDLPEVKYFCDNFLEAFEKNLDELSK